MPSTLTPPIARTLEQANAINMLLWARVEALTATIEGQSARILDLEARLGQNSSNSSRPPSSDAPYNKPKRKPPEAPSGRKAGGQPGHEGRTREAAEPDDVQDRTPTHCKHCGLEFPPGTAVGDVLVHQSVEIEVVRRVTEWRLRSCTCPNCKKQTRAERPVDMPQSAFGPRLEAAISMLSARYRLSRREVVEIVRDLFGAGLSVGSVQAICERVSEVIAPAVEAVGKDITVAPVVHADETGWKQKALKMWLWLAATDREAFFVLARDRGRDALAKLLAKEFRGVVHCDRWRPYERFAADWRQLCHSHLRRDFQALIDRGGVAKPLGERLLRASNRLFHLWHAFQRGELTRAEMALALVPVRMHVGTALADALHCDDRKARALAKDLRRQWPALWTFVHTEGVVPTNNDAERTLRPSVLWRRGSFGTQSDAGSRFVERMLTVIHTAKRRGIPLLDWLAAACAAPTPNLLLRPCLSG